MIPFVFLLSSVFAVTPVVIPPWANSETRLYDTAQVPLIGTFRQDSSTALAPAGLPSSSSAEADTGAYHLDLSGSKSLSISTGQGGGVGVDAALLVNIKGQVADNVYLEGSLSDQNVPVQPEGNTANLREVDNKYLRVYGREYEYLLGDYMLGYGREGEDRFSIKADGARLSYSFPRLGLSAQYAVSKGLFRTDTLRGVDGKQSGYYLRGRDGRTFITVLAGTEKIWRNGILLQRGSDYTIDYSQGRIDFQKEIWVTSENFFAAEFQYTEENFPRSIVGFELTDTAGPFRFSARAIQEWDDKNNPAAGPPDLASLNRFQQLGDSVLLDSAKNPVQLPQRLASGAFAADWDGGEHGNARFVLLGSLLDKNLYSSRDDGDNTGFSTRYHGVHHFGKPLDQDGFSRLEIEPIHEHRSAHFASFHQLVEPRIFRDRWNLDASVGEKDFDANSLRLSLEPHTGLMFGAEGGFAEGKILDSLHAVSRRGEVFAGVHTSAFNVGLSSEAKLAKDPNRRDNYRQKTNADALLAGWMPKAQLLHDTWLLALPMGSGQTQLWQPEVSLESPSLWNRWIWNTDVNALYGQSNYSGKLSSPLDSVLDIGLSQRLRLLAWGPFSGEAFAARRFHREWITQSNGLRSVDPQDGVYDQAQLYLAASGYPQGYGAQTHYQVSRTAEIPLINAYKKVDAGKGDYLFDSLLNAYERVETGGDYIFTGLQRDTTLGSRPYQDLQWTLHIDLSPGKWPMKIGGVLADIDFGLDVATDHQDSASDPIPLPRLTDGQIESVRSGHAHYEPSLRWHSREGQRSATARYQRDYSKGAGLYAFRELDWRTDEEYRWAWNEDWETLLGGTVQSKRREGLTASSPSESHVDMQQGRVELYRHLPHALTLIPSVEYERAKGEDVGFPVDLQGVTPKARLEKGSFYGGRASVEYALHSLVGTGEGSYFATDGYRKGLTHRVEVLAQSEIQTHLHLNLSYLARLEPHASSWDQKMTAEMRAVF